MKWFGICDENLYQAIPNMYQGNISENEANSQKSSLERNIMLDCNAGVLRATNLWVSVVPLSKHLPFVYMYLWNTSWTTISHFSTSMRHYIMRYSFSYILHKRLHKLPAKTTKTFVDHMHSYHSFSLSSYVNITSLYSLEATTKRISEALLFPIKWKGMPKGDALLCSLHICMAPVHIICAFLFAGL